MLAEQELGWCRTCLEPSQVATPASGLRAMSMWAVVAWLTPEGRSPALLRLTAAGHAWPKRGCGSAGMADVQVMWSCFSESHCCRERLAMWRRAWQSAAQKCTGSCSASSHPSGALRGHSVVSVSAQAAAGESHSLQVSGMQQDLQSHLCCQVASLSLFSKHWQPAGPCRSAGPLGKDCHAAHALDKMVRHSCLGWQCLPAQRSGGLGGEGIPDTSAGVQPAEAAWYDCPPESVHHM